MFRSSRFKILFPPFLILFFLALFMLQTPYCNKTKNENDNVENSPHHLDLNLHSLVDIHHLPKNEPEESLLRNSKDKLSSDLAPNNVFFVWCGKRWFEFRHYLSVISVIKNLDPDNIYFYYDNYPIMDHWIYNNWISYIKSDFPFFKIIEMKSACLGHKNYNRDWIKNRLSELGGIFMGENSFLTFYPLSLRKYEFIDAMNFEEQTGFLLGKNNLPGRRTFTELLKVYNYFFSYLLSFFPFFFYFFFFKKKKKTLFLQLFFFFSE